MAPDLSVRCRHTRASAIKKRDAGP
jgi:hypothetical protein